jgi:hypothetical protein
MKSDEVDIENAPAKQIPRSIFQVIVLVGLGSPFGTILLVSCKIPCLEQIYFSPFVSDGREILAPLDSLEFACFLSWTRHLTYCATRHLTVG